MAIKNLLARGVGFGTVKWIVTRGLEPAAAGSGTAGDGWGRWPWWGRMFRWSHMTRPSS